MYNLFQKKKPKMLVRMSAESSKGFTQDSNRCNRDFPSLWSKNQITQWSCLTSKVKAFLQNEMISEC